MTEDPLPATLTPRPGPKPLVSIAPAHAISPVWLGLMLALVAAVWFVGLGTRSLVSPDEGRYATLSLAMVNSGDWVTPRLNGFLYFEKPALQYWIGALSFEWLGVTEFAARFWPGLAGFLTVLLVGFTARRLWGREAGIRALAIAASTTWLFANSHFLTLDAGLTLFLTIALCAVLIAHGGSPSPSERRRWIWLAWAAMAGAVLSKGLVGIVIPGAALVLVSLWRRDWRLWRGMHWLSGLAIFLVLAAPWFAIVSLRNPGFAEFFFIHEHFARYLTEVHRREGEWWYYLPLLVIGMLPWTGALPWLFTAGDADRNGARRAQAGSIDARHVLIVWSAFVLLFFSMSGSKLPSYILPMFPALALWLAMRLDGVGAPVLRRHLWVPVLAWVIVLLGSTQVGRFASLDTPLEVLTPMATAARVGAVLFLVGAGIAWWQLGRGRVTAAVLSVALGHFAATALVLQAHNRYGQQKSAEPMAAVLAPYLAVDAAAPFFSVRDYDQTLPFYLRRNVVLVDYVDEFALGEQREPGQMVPTLDAFVERWNALPRAAAYMSPFTWGELYQRGVPMRVLFHDFRRVVVVKP